jgi:O-methyltransferase/aklanonic acid methyltransferase
MYFNSKEIIKRTFDESAKKFDEIGTPFFKYYGKIMADLSEIRHDDSILDIACGKGATAFPILEKLSNKGKIYGIDISSKMIEECKKQLKDMSVHNIDFLVMDAECLEFADESIDKVLSGFGLFFLSDIEKGLKEIRRVLKPNGLLVFSSWNNDYQLKWLNETISKYVPDIIKNIQVNDEKIHESDFRTPQGIEKILEISGFKKEQILIENIDCYYDNEEEWIETRWHTAYRMYFEQLSEKDYLDLKNKLIQNLSNYKENGKLKITMSALITKATLHNKKMM